jgi:hypothetical protein
MVEELACGRGVKKSSTLLASWMRPCLPPLEKAHTNSSSWHGALMKPWGRGSGVK